MEIGEFLIYSIMVIVVIFLAAIIGAVFGAFAGWILGFTPIGDWILKFLAAAQIHTNMVDFGAFCGFVGGFFSGSWRSKD